MGTSTRRLARWQEARTYTSPRRPSACVVAFGRNYSFTTTNNQPTTGLWYCDLHERIKYEGTFINGERDGKGVLRSATRTGAPPPLLQPHMCFVFASLWKSRHVDSLRDACKIRWKIGSGEEGGHGRVPVGQQVDLPGRLRQQQEGKGIMIYNSSTTGLEAHSIPQRVHSRTWHHTTTRNDAHRDRYEGEWKGGAARVRHGNVDQRRQVRGRVARR